jgi:hypothetical protein
MKRAKKIEPMKLIFVLIFSLNISFLFGQEKREQGLISYREEAEKVEDKIDGVEVIILEDAKQPVIFINGKACPTIFGDTILMSQLEFLKTRLRQDTIINNVKYYGKIYFTIKEGYDFNPVSLNFIKEKYTKLKDQPVIFFINENIIKEDPENYFMDEKLVRKITIGKLKSPDMNYVDISTKN